MFNKYTVIPINSNNLLIKHQMRSDNHYDLAVTEKRAPPTERIRETETLCDR